MVTKVAAILLGILLLLPSKHLVEDSPTFPESEWDRQVQCLYSAVYHEAKGEPSIGKKAVMEVVLNRAKNRKQSICDVVKSPHQFSWYSPKISLKVNVNVLTEYNTVARMGTVVEDSTEYFHSVGKPSWARGMRLVRVVGNHKFYSTKEN